LWVTTGDFNGDGKAELVVAADAGGGPHVKTYSDIYEVSIGPTRTLTDSFYAFDASFRGGVRVAVGKFPTVVNNVETAVDHLVVAAGPGGPPVVKVFSNTDLNRVVSDG